MNKSLWLLSVPVCALSACATHPVKQPNDLSGFRPWYSTRKFYYIGEPSEAAQKAGYNYKDIVIRASQKNTEALKELLTMRVPFDGAAAELHQSVIAEMILLWGDYDFSRAISPLPKKAKDDLRLRFGGNVDNFRMCFPQTADILFGFVPSGEPKY